MRFRVAALLGALAMASCATGASPARQAQLQGLVGHTESDAITVLGVPSRTAEADGHRFLQWDQSSQTTYPQMWGYGWGPPWYGGVPPVVEQYTCQTTAMLMDGRIATWSVRGNGC